MPAHTNFAYERLGMLIDGRWIYETEKRDEVLDPATGQIIGHLPHATDADLASAVSSAQRAFESWKTVRRSSAARSCAASPTSLATMPTRSAAT
jgi:acyl-CoA reductase-like NAD-dependent aldehyde dehydrogenase